MTSTYGACSFLHLKACDFFNETLAFEDRIQSGHQLCDGLESSSTDKELPDLIHSLCERIQKFLSSTEPQILQESPIQQLRRISLEILQKVPNGDHVRPYARSILSLLFKLVEVENEENVLLCVKLIIDLHKYYRPSFSLDVTSFLTFVRRVYRGLQNETSNIFDPRSPIEVQSFDELEVGDVISKTFTITTIHTQEPKEDGTFKTYHILPKSCFSLKVMQEIPILVVLMYQLFKQHIHQDVSEFIPLIMDFINLKPTDVQRKNPRFDQDVFVDFMAAQVKTLSFLAYVIKIYQDLVERHSTNLVMGIMNLLYNCPPSVTNMRKEFFIAARHILSAPDIRPKFLGVLDELMNEDILIGQGYTVRDALRPLAYSTLADLTHHIRSDLSLAKIARAIDLYGRNMHDDTLPFSIQQMSLRLLLNLVECVRQRTVAATSTAGPSGTVASGTSSGTARHLLLQTLRLCVLKARIVAEHYLPALESSCIPETSEENAGDRPKHRLCATPTATGGAINMDTSDCGGVSITASSSTDGLKNANASSGDVNKSRTSPLAEHPSKGHLSHLDLRSLIKALMTGIRTIVTSMIQCPKGSAYGTHTSAPSTHTPKTVVAASSSRILSPDELIVLTEYFDYGTRMIAVVQIIVRDGKLFIRSHPSVKSPDERILIETFALTFAQLSPVSFQEIFSNKIHDFVMWCRQSPSYTNMALHLLSQPNKTSIFGHILLSYLVDRLDRLGDGTDESALYTRLLKLCFSSVNMAGTENEYVMKLHLRRIVQGSMQCCLTANEPTAYLTLLRTLFRSIGGGAHDKLYREFFPLLPEMLSILNRLLRSPHHANARDLLGELCVIVPVRLSTLLPYLSLLMEPLIYVLNCNTVNQGLRTLELCVDNMQPDFLHEHLYQVRGDMLLALYNSLHSSSEYVQKLSFKVLGKLGRFNRTNMSEVRRLRLDPAEGETGPELRLFLNEYRNQPIDLPLRSLVDAAIEVLQDSNVDQPTKLRSWEFLQSVCIASLDLDNKSGRFNLQLDAPYSFLQGTSFVRAVDMFVQKVLCNEWVSSSDRELFQAPCCIDGDLDRYLMVRVLAGLFLAGLNKPLRETQGDFITSVVRHLVIVWLAEHMNQIDQTLETKPPAIVAPSAAILDPIARMEDGPTLIPLMVSPEPSYVGALNGVCFKPDRECHSNRRMLDATLLIDAILFAMGQEDKQLTQPMCVLLEVVHGTVSTVFRSALSEDSGDETGVFERANRALIHLPLYSHIAHVLVDMLHHPAWYVKWGACATVICLVRLLHPTWFAIHFIPILRGLVHCIHDLSTQMSQGALAMARDCARLLMQTVFDPSNEDVLSLQPSTSLDDDESSRAPIQTGSNKRPTPNRRRQNSSTPVNQKRPMQLRRGRSASMSSSNPSSSTLSGSPEAPEQESLLDESSAGITDRCSTSKQTPLFLIDAVVLELLKALMSETPLVREEARCLLCLLSHRLDRPLSVLLAPHWRTSLGHLLPPQPPTRLYDLPASTQLAVLELNYFFGQAEGVETKSKSGNGKVPFDVCTGGAGLLKYDLAKRADRSFLIDVRALLNQVDQNNSVSPSTTASPAGTPTSEGASFALGVSRPAYKAGSPMPTVHRLRSVDLPIVACRVLSLTWYLTSQKAQNLAALFKGICCEKEAIHETAFVCLKEFVSHTPIDIELRHANVKPILQNVRQTTNLRLNTARQLSYCAQLFPSTFSERLCDAIYSHLNTLVDTLATKQNASSISTLTPPTLELCAVLVDLFHLIPLATAKHVSLLIELVIRAERALNIEPTSPLRLPLVRFLARYPAETCANLLTGSKWPYDAHAQRILLYVVGCTQGQSVAEYLKTNHHILSDLIRPTEISEQKSSTPDDSRCLLPRYGTPLTAACPRHLAIRVVHLLRNLFPNWLLHTQSITEDSPKSKYRYKALGSPSGSKSCSSSCHPVVASLLSYWRSDVFARRQAHLTLVTLNSGLREEGSSLTPPGMEFVEPEEKTDAGYSASAQHQPVTDSSLEPGLLISSGTSCWEHWDEPRLLLDCLLDCVRSDPDNCDLLFIVVIGSTRLRSVAGLYPLRTYLDTFLPTASISWHRRLFLHYVSLVRHRLTDTHGVDPCPVVIGANWNTTSGDLYRLLTHLMIPSLTCALQNTSHEEFIGVPPDPYTDNDKDLVHLFISVLLGDPDVQRSTELRVMYYQIAILFTHYVPEYIHLEGPTPQSSRLERLISFAWPCTTSSLSVVDLQEKYTGLQLLAHLISKFDTVKPMAVQVFHCLAKGTHTETKKIVNPALDVLIPAWVQGPDEQQILASTTRKIMLEDHGIQSCIHVLGIIVRHADLYYPIRRQLLPHLILIISRLSTQQLPVEQRRLALDMIDTAARWDHRCRQVLLESGMDGVEYTSSVSTSVENLYPEQSSPRLPLPLPEGAPIDKTQRDQLLNLMIRFACQAVDTSQNGNMSEASVTRALTQLEFALRSDVWGTESCELRLGFIDRYFIPEDNSNPNPSGTAVSVTGPGGSGAPSVSSASTVTGSNIPGSNAGNASSGSLGTTQTTNLLMALEVLRILFTSLESPTLLQNVKHFSPGLCTLLTRQLANVRLIRSCSNLLRAVLERFPADASHRQKITAYSELFDIYSATLKTIQESFSLYSDNGPKPTLLARLQSAFLLFNATQVQTNPHAFVDRCLVQLVKLTHRLIQDVISPGYSSGSQDTVASAQLTDLLINGLEVIKSRLNVVSNEMRKNSFGPDLCLILDRARDARLFRAVIKILRDWINVPKSEEHFAPTAREKVNFFHKLWQAYPRWIDSNPDVARELLECVYEVYVSGNLSRNQELYMKLEQAFCCSLLAPFPDIREKFTSLYLEASQLQFPLQSGTKIAGTDTTTSHPDITFTEASLNESSSAASSPRPATDLAGDREPDLLEMNSPLVCHSASLLVRLLFLFVSCNWDEAHFRDGFWLSLFLDVLLCDVDTTLPPCLSDTSNCFPVPPVVTPVTEQTTLIRSESELFKTMSSSQSELNSLLELQTRGLKDMGRVTFREGLRGLLCLTHRSPALASHLFSQLWPQLWNRLLLRQTPMESSLITDSDYLTPTLNFGPVDETSADPLTISSQNLNAAEIRAFVIPQLLRFLTSDQHVNPSEPQPSALGAFLSSLATTPDSALLYLPVPAISYIGCSYNQWYTVALFLESLCARALKSPGASEFVYSVGLPPPDSVDSSTAGCLRLSDLPSGAAALSLIALYDGLGEVDHFTAAWWYRFALNGSTESRPASVRSSPFLRCLEYAKHGLTLRALEVSLDQLAANQPLGSGQQALESITVASSAAASSNRTGSSTSARYSTPFSTSITVASACELFSEHVNRSRLHDYCVRYLKQLGQWDSLDALASSSQTSSAFSMSGPSVSGPGGSTTAGGSSVGGSAYWGLKADAAWRRSDWSEVYSSLARLANECPRSDLCRYALIQATACVAGRRASAFSGSASVVGGSDVDAYGSGNLGPSAVEIQSTVPGSPAVPISSSSSTSGASIATHTMVTMLQASELENHRVMTTMLREWRRLPMIVTNQHIPLLQTAHRAVEIVEGNSLLAQYCGGTLGGPNATLPSSTYSASPGQASSTPSSIGVPSTSNAPTSAAASVALRMHEYYKTMFKSWQSRPPAIGDDLGFWHDLFSWRQVVEETIISCHPHVQKFGSERANLVAVCERELAFSQLQLARGARKHNFPSIAQQHLDRYTRMNLPPLFEKTKQEIKLKMFDLRKDELLEGLELMEKTNIQQYEKKDRAQFFCYKAVFFSHFNKQVVTLYSFHSPSHSIFWFMRMKAYISK
ncbi:hypothetical protein CRM22_005642 [Opisthorchis felineus]|uniref:PIK-related kinase FAT domain-containing protein n=1 Tax=Opisthorchis felineus TaxID=147828 RepID=A0A4S2LQ85_OPIFE|nr:hypothetical protein CRM22_005642 [Opisthorchis felineus]